MKKKDSRRKFIKGALAAFGSTITVNAVGENKKVKMLTPDGELVEVDQSVLQNSKSKKVSNQDILDWSNQIKS